MRVSFLNVGQIGVVKDVPDWQLPPAAWTHAENVRFRENAAWRFHGFIEFKNLPGVVAQFAMPAIIDDKRWWIYAGMNKVYATADGLHYNITRQSGGVDQNYSFPETFRWNGTVLGGVPILNNGQNVPQAWIGAASTVRLQNLPNWPSTGPDNLRAQIVRSFKNYLIALRLRKGVSAVDGSGGTLYSTLLRWSHPADPGEVPISWDVTDETKDAGEHDLQGERGDEIIDCLLLGDTNVIYKAESVHAMSYVGGISVFAFRRLFGDFGMLAMRCAADIGNKHFVVTDSDIVVHNGQTYQSLLNDRLKRYLFSNIDPTYYRNSFVLNYKDAREVWFCFPAYGTGPDCTKALVWNSDENSIGFRDLPGVREGDAGRLGHVGLSDWESLSQTWEELNFAWNDTHTLSIGKGVVLPKPVDGALLVMDRSYNNAGIGFSTVLERTALRFDAGDQSAALNSTETVKQIQSIYPTFEADNGTGIQIAIGAQDRPKGPIRWGLPKTFTVGASSRVDLVDTIESSKLPALRFSSASGKGWKLTGFAMDVQIVGAF